MHSQNQELIRIDEQMPRVVNDGETDKVTNVNVHMQVTLFKTVVNGILERNEKGIRICVDSEAKEGDQMNITDLKEMLKTNFNFKLDTTGLDSVASYFGIDDPNNVTVEISRIFYLASFGNESEEETAADRINRETEEKNATEFAFKISILHKPKTPEKLHIFTFNSLSFAVWRTENEKVLESMKLYSIDNLLKKIK